MGTITESNWSEWVSLKAWGKSDEKNDMYNTSKALVPATLEFFMKTDLDLFYLLTVTAQSFNRDSMP